MACVDVNAAAYAQLLRLFLRRGEAWTIPVGGVFDRLLHALAEEFHRIHAEACALLAVPGIEPVPGWSAPAYEQLLASRFGIEATVSDGLMPLTCEMHCEAPLLPERIVFVFVITVDDLSVFTPDVLAYLNAYKQSHTAFHIRDRSVALDTTEYPALRCDDHCESPVYERDYQTHALRSDWSYTWSEQLELLNA